MEYISESLKSVFDQSLRRELVLPNFQRDFVWTREAQTQLLASFMASLPIGSVLLVQGEGNYFAARELCYVNSVTPQEKCSFLLDGQQRISCLKSIFSDIIPANSWRVRLNDLFSPLQNRWFVKIQPPENSDDIWGWNSLRFEKDRVYDPSQIEDFVICKRILPRRDTDAWFHPAFSPVDSNGNPIISEESKRFKLARIFAENSLVPLFEIYSDKGENALHILTLKQIATNRRNELRAQAENGEFSILEILSHLDPDIEEILSGGNVNRLNDLWAELYSDWQRDVRVALESLLLQEVLETVLPYNEIHRATSIFETINKGGTPLSVFDLMVARVSIGGNQSLAEKLKEHCEAEINIPISVCNIVTQWSFQNMKAITNNSIAKVIKDQFLNLLSILCYEEALESGLLGIKVEHIKQPRILGLTASQVNAKSEIAINSLVRGYAFLQFRCGILSLSDISYSLTILPIAYLLGKDEIWNDPSKVNKIEYWYWSSLFSGAYREKQNERTIQDLQQLREWIVNGSTAAEDVFNLRVSKVLEDSNYSDKSVLLLETVPEYEPPTAIRNGILQYILSKQPRDFRFDREDVKLKAWEFAKNNDKLEDHHLIPLGSATKIGQSSSELRRRKEYILNSPLNRTYISHEANRLISDMPPDVYLNYLQDLALYGHAIPGNIVAQLNNQANESDEDKYKRVLGLRFDELKREIKMELDQLKQ